jgi:hypothetical protein
VIVVDSIRSVIIIIGVASPIAPGERTTINDIPLSLDTSASFIVVDGTKTIDIPQATSAPADKPLVVGGTTVNVGQLATQLQPGQVTTINGVPVSLDPATSFVVIHGTNTIPLHQITAAHMASAVTIGGTTVDSGQLISQITPGQITTIGGDALSFELSAVGSPARAGTVCPRFHRMFALTHFPLRTSAFSIQYIGLSLP